MRAVIGVHIGVQKINVTLKFEEMVFSDPLAPHIDMAKLHYNEQFAITDVSSMSRALKSAYKHGLPYPILSVLEYLSLNQDAFDWGKHYRTAGHYTHAAMCFALSVWCLSLALLLFLPHSYGMAMLICGAACLIGNLIYLLLSPCELQVAFTGVYGERVNLDVSFQTIFYLVFAVGVLAISKGLLLILLQALNIYSLSTFLDSTLDSTVGPKSSGGYATLQVAGVQFKRQKRSLKWFRVEK
ncbi:hypothetical protein WR25_04693 [Diploscapter pachys]|uniref:DUOXA-like protein C06E1.3 n=1 Tax=Diploscapter pachys TaxID=2018661 RepID=A0A2A2J6F2_9BILA|nr:hypothetical protein WR25_04693 [Diploscapter pachys]